MNKPSYSMLMGYLPKYHFIARAPQGLSLYQEEKKVLLPFTAENLWDNIGMIYDFNVFRC